MNEEEIIEKIKEHPHTYKTLLGENFGRNSSSIELKRKIYRAINYGVLHRVCLNGARGGQCLITHRDKKHIIIIVVEHLDFKYYCCERIEEVSKSRLRLVNCEELTDYEWIKLKNDPEIFSGNIMKMM
jgi:hypothetical protein